MNLSRFVLAVVVSGVVFTANAHAAPGVQNWNRFCIKFYADWKMKPKHRAFAVSTAENWQSCGGSWGYETKEQARAAAHKWCKKYSEGGASCRVTAVE